MVNRVPTCVWKPETNIFVDSIKFLNYLFLVDLDGFRSFQMVLDCYGWLFLVALDGFRSF